MTANDRLPFDLDAQLERMLRDRAAAADPGALRGQILAATSTTGQVRRPLFRLPAPQLWIAGRPAIAVSWLVALLVLALVAALVLGPGRYVVDRLLSSEASPSVPPPATGIVIATEPPPATPAPTAILPTSSSVPAFPYQPAAAWTGTAYTLGVQLDCSQGVVTTEVPLTTVGGDACGRVSWSRGLLAYSIGQQVHVVGLDGTGDRVVYTDTTPAGTQVDMFPTLSPVANEIWVERCRGVKCPARDFFAVPVSGGPEVALSGGGAWSRDGTSLVVDGPISEDYLLAGGNLDLLSSSGVLIRRLATSGTVVSGSTLAGFGWQAVSPADPTQIAFVGFGTPTGGERGIFVATADGSSMRRLTPIAAYGPVWSPDGTQIAFVEGSYAETSTAVAVVDVTTGSVTRVFGPDSTVFIDRVSWSADGRWLGFTTVALNEGGPVVLHVISPDGKTEHHLAGALSPTWSPAGPALAFVDASRTVVNGSDGPSHGLYVATEDLSQVVRVLDVSLQVSAPVWLP